MDMTKLLNPAALTMTMIENPDDVPAPKVDLLPPLPPWCTF